VFSPLRVATTVSVVVVIVVGPVAATVATLTGDGISSPPQVLLDEWYIADDRARWRWTEAVLAHEQGVVRQCVPDINV
jgi:hypothetical protein